MYPLAFATLGMALVAFWLSWVQPLDTAKLNQAQTSAYAANFWAYRDTLVAYQNDNYQTAQGFIPNIVLSAPFFEHPTGYFALGYQVMQTPPPLPTNLWKHYFEAGRLYTFSSIPARKLPPGVIDAIFKYRDNSLMMGIKQANGTMVSAYRLKTDPVGHNTGAIFTLPPITNIPVGALVVVGN